jgi:hypothetical protein
MMSLLPIILGLICYGVWVLIAYFNKDYKTVMTKAISSLVILLFLVHPNIIQYMFSALK